MKKITGQGLATTITVKTTKDGNVTEKTYSMLTDILPKISADEYKTYTTVEVNQRANKMYEKIGNVKTKNRPIRKGSPCEQKEYAFGLKVGYFRDFTVLVEGEVYQEITTDEQNKPFVVKIPMDKNSEGVNIRFVVQSYDSSVIFEPNFPAEYIKTGETATEYPPGLGATLGYFDIVFYPKKYNNTCLNIDEMEGTTECITAYLKAIA